MTRAKARSWLVGAFAALLLVSGASCSSIRSGAIRISEEDFNNWACVVEMGQNFYLSWPAKSQFIRCSLGSDIDKLPLEAIKAMDRLDELWQKPSAQLSDGDFTCAAALHGRLFGVVVMRALEVYAPDVFRVMAGVALK